MNRNNNYLIGNKFAVGSKPNKTAFRPGQKPWNLGMKGWSPTGSEKGHFKKGQRGRSFVPIGTVTIRTDKNGKQRRMIKIRDTGPFAKQWIMYSTWLWEKNHGPIPKGLFI